VDFVSACAEQSAPVPMVVRYADAVAMLRAGVTEPEVRARFGLTPGQVGNLRRRAGIRRPFDKHLYDRGRGLIDQPLSATMHERLFDLSGFREGVWHHIAEKRLNCWVRARRAPMPADVVDAAAEAGLLLTAVRYFGMPGAPDRRAVKVAMLTAKGVAMQNHKGSREI